MVKEKNKNIKLIKCPACRKAFYVRVDKKGKFKLKCPYCEQVVNLIINDEDESKTSQPTQS